MKVREQAADNAELIARMDKDAGLPGVGMQPKSAMRRLSYSAALMASAVAAGKV